MHALAAMGMGEPQPGLTPEQFTGIRHDFYRHLQAGEDLADFRPWDPEVADLVRKLVGGDHDEPPQPVYPQYTIEQILSEPPVEFLIDGFLPKQSLCVMFGPPKQGKSFVAYDMGCCIAAGIPWQGHATKQTDVIIVAGEGQSGLGGRFQAWVSHYETTPERVRIIKEPVQLFEGGYKNIRNFIDGILASGQQEPLIILDTLAACAFGMEENSAKDMGMLIANVRPLIDELRATVLILHHANKSNGEMRGSTALLGAVDCQLQVTQEGSLITVTVPNSKDFDSPEPLLLRRQKHLNSCIVIPYTSGKSGTVSADWITVLEYLFDLSFTEGGATYSHLREMFTTPGPNGRPPARIRPASFPGVLKDLWGDDLKHGTYIHNPDKVAAEADGKKPYNAKYFITDAGKAVVASHRKAIADHESDEEEELV